MKHSQLFRLCLTKLVHNIESKVEGVCILKLNFCRSTRFVCLHINPLLPYTGSLCLTLHFPGYRCISHWIQLRNRCTRRVEDYSVELTVFSSYSDHSMRNGRVKVTSVSRVKSCLMFPYLDKKLTRNTDIHFLSVMSCKLYIVVFSFFVIFALNV